MSLPAFPRAPFVPSEERRQATAKRQGQALLLKHLLKDYGARLRLPLPVRKINLHQALAKFFGLRPDSVREALPSKPLSVSLLSISLARLTPRLRFSVGCAASGEQQDKKSTHFFSPSVNNEASIYFLPEIGCTRLSVNLGQGRISL